MPQDLGSIEPILERSLIAGPDHPATTGEVRMQIGLAPEVELPDINGAAAYRLTPLTGWRTVFGVDRVQAVVLAVDSAEAEAEALGLLWPDGEAFTRLPSAGRSQNDGPESETGGSAG